jgi:SecD/SecF fusion protein
VPRSPTTPSPPRKLAFIIGTALTVAFILFFYTTGGVVAAVGMGVNVLIILGVMASIGATLTMPGIAGIVLTLAMSVDSNILIFERMREELKLGKSLPFARGRFREGVVRHSRRQPHDPRHRVIMILLGTGPVKGFGVTLAIGIFTTMFAAVVVSQARCRAAHQRARLIKKLPMFSVLQNTNFDFLKYAKPGLHRLLVVIA